MSMWWSAYPAARFWQLILHSRAKKPFLCFINVSYTKTSNAKSSNKHFPCPICPDWPRLNTDAAICCRSSLKTTFSVKPLSAIWKKNAKGPFAIISATDMGIGERFNFTQEYFDPMCIDLGDLRLARAVAASSSVPMVFAPITLNNNGGHCQYTLPLQLVSDSEAGKKQLQTRKEFFERFQKYSNSKNRPYIHLIDGGLTDNLGMRSLLDMTEMYPEKILTHKIKQNKIRHIVVINVNAQNEVSSNLDKSAAVPGFRDVVSAIVNIPIDQHSQESLRRFRAFVDQWNKDKRNEDIYFSFVSLNLKDLPPSRLRDKVLNIPTSFYLSPEDVDNLRTAAAELMKQSLDYRNLLAEFAAHPNPDTIFAAPPPDAQEFKPLNEKEKQEQTVP